MHVLLGRILANISTITTKANATDVTTLTATVAGKTSTIATKADEFNEPFFSLRPFPMPVNLSIGFCYLNLRFSESCRLPFTVNSLNETFLCSIDLLNSIFSSSRTPTK